MKFGIILAIPQCSKCKIPFKIVKSPKYNISDGWCYECSICNGSMGIRKNSFLDEFSGITIMEIIRIIFFYFSRGYGVDDVVRECKSVIGEGFGQVMSRGLNANDNNLKLKIESAKHRSK